jgi:hypothetical protein
MRASFFSLLIITCLFSFSQKKSNTIPKPPSTKKEDQIIDTIFKLKEVKERAKYVESQTQGKRHLQYSIWEKPTETTPYYWVKVMEDNGVSTYTHFNFFVYPKTMAIKYFDTINDETIDLKTWRAPIDTTNILVKEIRNEYHRINSNSSNLKIVSHDIEGQSTEGGELKKFYEGNILKKAILTFYGEMGMNFTEYYFKDGNLIFSYKVEKWYNKPMTMEGSKIYSVVENRYYFYNQKLIQWVNNKGKIEDKSLYPDKEKEILLDVKDIHK